MEQALVKASPPTKSIESGQSITASLHARKRGRTLAGGSALCDAVHQAALADDGDGGAFRIQGEQCVDEASDAGAGLGKVWAPRVVYLCCVCGCCGTCDQIVYGICNIEIRLIN